MTQVSASDPIARLQDHPRKIVHRTRGRRQGPVTLLVSPGELGQELKPFIVLGLLDTQKASFPGFGLHPHSGIATLTFLFEGSFGYEDTTGAMGMLPEGGVEWFKSGHGAWHAGDPAETGRARGFQLWVALPPEHELGPVESVYQRPEDVVQEGPARVLMGAYGGAVSSLRAPAPLNYFAVRLKEGEKWRYQPPADHSVAFIALASGRVSTPEAVQGVELVIFEPGNAPINIEAAADTELVLGSAAPYPHGLVSGHYSVHTCATALEAGERRINEIRAGLQAKGRL
jgi:redox-sensitive bicupin YhaK (pirin superfamily)